jgi:hypothetical protein
MSIQGVKMKRMIQFYRNRCKQDRHKQLVDEYWMIKDMDVPEIMERYHISLQWASILRIRAGGESKRKVKRVYTDDELTIILGQMFREVEDA